MAVFKRDKLTLCIKGFCMGTADVIPGVSGGTMALILGIYVDLIDAIKSFDLVWINSILKLDRSVILHRPHFTFLIPLATGIIIALLFFTRIIPVPNLLITHPEIIYGLFFGLITGSIIILLKELNSLAVLELILLGLGIISGLLIFNLVPLTTPEAPWFIFFSGCIAICAMILPGISGSFILLILNKYSYIFNAIGYFNFTVLIPFALGAITGLVLFSRALSYLLHHYYKRTMIIITGLLIASLWRIWPFQDRVYSDTGSKPKLIGSMPVLPDILNSTVIISIMMTIIGLVCVLILHRLAQKKLVNAE